MIHARDITLAQPDSEGRHRNTPGTPVGCHAVEVIERNAELLPQQVTRHAKAGER